MKSLIIGADGFAGGWLSKFLEESGDEVWCGVGPSHSTSEPKRTMKVDVRDPASINSLLSWARPEIVYHLAAVSFGPAADADVVGAIDVTVRGTAVVIDAAARYGALRVLVPSSSEVYGRPVSDPIAEDHPVAPVNAYGVSKLAQEVVAMGMGRARNVEVSVMRAFNHIGPGQRPTFAVAGFAEQLAEIARGRRPPTLYVGNLEVERDFSDVRDVVAAYRLVAKDARVHGPLNVASGTAVRLGDIVSMLIASSGLAVEVQVEPQRFRAFDVARIRGDASMLRTTMGWAPVITLAQTVADIWDHAVSTNEGGRVANGRRRHLHSPERR